MRGRLKTRSAGGPNRGNPAVELSRPNRGDGKVVDDQDADLGDGGEAFAEAAVGMTEGQFPE